MAKFSLILPILINFVIICQIWCCQAHYAKYGQTWSNMAPNGPEWPVMIKDDQLWSPIMEYHI